MEVGERGRLYTYRYTVTTRITSALRWAAMRTILISQDSVHRPQPLSLCLCVCVYESLLCGGGGGGGSGVCVCACVCVTTLHGV